MEYTTWYEFKRDCEKQSGRMLPNRTWLMLKPSRPLPWNERDARKVLFATAQLAGTARRRELEVVRNH